MAVYFVIQRSAAEGITAIFDANGFGRAKAYKQDLVRDGKYREDQITISGTDLDGNEVTG